MWTSFSVSSDRPTRARRSCARSSGEEPASSAISLPCRWRGGRDDSARTRRADFHCGRIFGYLVHGSTISTSMVSAPVLLHGKAVRRVFPPEVGGRPDRRRRVSGSRPRLLDVLRGRPHSPMSSRSSTVRRKVAHEGTRARRVLIWRSASIVPIIRVAPTAPCRGSRFRPAAAASSLGPAPLDRLWAGAPT